MIEIFLVFCLAPFIKLSYFTKNSNFHSISLTPCRICSPGPNLVGFHMIKRRQISNS